MVLCTSSPDGTVTIPGATRLPTGTKTASARTRSSIIRMGCSFSERERTGAVYQSVDVMICRVPVAAFPLPLADRFCCNNPCLRAGASFMWVADAGNNMIRKIRMSDRTVTTVCGVVSDPYDGPLTGIAGGQTGSIVNSTLDTPLVNPKP